MQEFLVLHYLATDSAREWDVFLDSCLPECTWVRAALALHMYDKCHIAPSHRRFAHPAWIAGMKLMLDLLLGARKHRYLGRCLAAPRPAEVYVRGFSAGSYSGICLLHLLWNMPHVQVGGILGGISCPPALIHGISPEHGQRIMLIHLTTDRLCQWHPYDKTLHSLNCKYCIVDRKTQELKELFGSCEHSYGHWIDISLPHGRYPLYQLLRRFADVAPPQARDIAPLRLVSWVSCEVPDHVQQVLNQLMVLFGAVAPVSSDEVIAIGTQLLGVTSSGEISWDMVRDALIREITFGGAKCPTEEVCRLLVDFLQRLPLPRLVHFLDMILPQMVPVQSPCQSRRRRFASSYRVAERTAGGEWDVGYTLNVTKLYWSRSGIMHVAIAWDHKPLLLLATALLPNRTTASFESEAGPPYDKQRIQMGLRSGNTVLISFRSGVGHFQCVLIALSADLHTNKQWQGQHKFWKYVSPLRTYFAWLPERLARTYCSAALDKCSDYVTHYHKVRRLHLIVVDLWRPWKYNTARAKAITDQLWYISHCDATHRVSPFRPDGPEPPLRCRRFAYGYALDGSECPSYLVWPQRDGHSYVLLDTSTNDTLRLNQEFFRPLGMEHFYDSFALESQISVRREAMRLFGLREDELMPDLHITRDGVLRIRLGAHQEHEVNHVARATDRTKVSAAVIQLASHEEDTAPQQDMSEGDASDSDGSESASDSEQNDPPSSLVADAEQYELMQRAYAAVGEDFTGKDDLIGAKYSKLLRLEMVPERWPLARLSFSLQTRAGGMLLGSTSHTSYTL